MNTNRMGKLVAFLLIGILAHVFYALGFLIAAINIDIGPINEYNLFLKYPFYLNILTLPLTFIFINSMLGLEERRLKIEHAGGVSAAEIRSVLLIAFSFFLISMGACYLNYYLADKEYRQVEAEVLDWRWFKKKSGGGRYFLELDPKPFQVNGWIEVEVDEENFRIFYPGTKIVVPYKIGGMGIGFFDGYGPVDVRAPE